MQYKIYITNDAKKMLNKHITSLSKMSISAAIKLKNNIKDHFVILKYFPKIGRKLYAKKQLPIQYRKLVVNKKHILIYYISKSNIYIDAILDSRQNNIYYKF